MKTAMVKTIRSKDNQLVAIEWGDRATVIVYDKLIKGQVVYEFGVDSREYIKLLEKHGVHIYA